MNKALQYIGAGLRKACWGSIVALVSNLPNVGIALVWAIILIMGFLVFLSIMVRMIFNKPDDFERFLRLIKTLKGDKSVK